MRAILPIDDGDAPAAVRGLLKRLLEKGAADAVLAPLETPAGSVTPALVTEPELLDHAVPLAPVMGLNSARLAGLVSVRQPRGRVAAVLRPCELRALVELVKLKQASLDDLLTVGLDCLGTYDVPAFAALRADGGPDMAGYLAAARAGQPTPQPGFAFRDACQMCERPFVQGADVAVELLGADLSAGVPVSLPDDLAEALDLAPAGDEGSGARQAAIDSLVAQRTEVRDARFAEVRGQLEQEGIASVLSDCVRCHNCMTVCPICYCRTCLFESPVMEHEPMEYVTWARRKGAYRMPPDTTLFHLTRLNHMALSCIGCGMCTDACPAELPVGRVFRAIGQQVQTAFEYEPGRSVEEPLPLATFSEDEWMDVGEE